MSRLGRCSSCSAPVIWAITTAGRRIPIEPDTDAAGNIWLDTATTPPTAHVLRAGTPPPGPLHVSHFARCPNADRHRHPRRDPAQLELGTS